MPRDYSRFSENLRIAVADRVLRLTLHNPDKLNANTEAMHRALSLVWDEIQDDPDVDLVILTGAGERAFSAGGDPRQMQKMVDEVDRWWRTHVEARRILWRMLEFDKPLIARVNGHAVGFGATLALACDIVVAVEDAKIGDPHAQVGLVCGDGGALLWAQHIGYMKARELLFTGELISAREARQLGLINHAVARDALDATVDAIAAKILGAAPLALRLTKNAINLPLRQLAHQTMDAAMSNEMLTALSDDHREAIRAMIEKDTPRFRGR